MIIQICVGSSCHLKGSEEIVEICKNAIEKNKLEDEVTLSGMFCASKCNRVGVTVTIDDEPYTGLTPASFDAFFEDKVLRKLKSGEE